MARLKTTVGQLLINEALPEDLRDYERVYDNKGTKALFTQLAQKGPDAYRIASKKLLQAGYDSAYTSGVSFGLQHIRTAISAKAARARLTNKLRRIMADSKLSDKQRSDQIIQATDAESEPMKSAIMDETKLEGNPIADIIGSGARGSAMNLRSLRGGDMLYMDHKDETIPIPVLHSYAEGLTPAEYFAGAYGARKGVIDVKLGVADAGKTGKQMNQASHRLIVTDLDSDDQEIRGLPVDTDDSDNEGALLALPTGGYPKNTVLTPKVLNDLKARKIGKLLIRSPLVRSTPDGGLYARDVGVRERGGLSARGDFVGMTSAQALSEVLTQAGLSSKHTGGVAGAAKTLSGYDYIDQMLSVPAHFKGGASHAQVDGTVESVDPIPTGGTHVTIAGKQHFVAPGFVVALKPGSKVEAGDVISDGIPNPAEVVKHKGIGEGRRYFMEAMRDAYLSSGLPIHRRNVEVVAHGLINHVRLNDELGDNMPDDVVPYNTLEHRYEPRDEAKLLRLDSSLGKYLERPILHYSIGTKVRESMLPNLKQFGVQQLLVHDEPAPFEPTMVRALENTTHDPDFMTKMLGSYLERGLLRGVHRGGKSMEAGTSYVPSLARGVDFGKVGPIRAWKPIEVKKQVGLTI